MAALILSNTTSSGGNYTTSGDVTLVVPGLAVRRYVVPAAQALRERGLKVNLLDAPGSPGAAADLGEYGHQLAGRLDAGPPVDLLVGLSVGRKQRPWPRRRLRLCAI